MPPNASIYIHDISENQNHHEEHHHHSTNKIYQLNGNSIKSIIGPGEYRGPIEVQQYGNETGFSPLI